MGLAHSGTRVPIKVSVSGVLHNLKFIWEAGSLRLVGEVEAIFIVIDLHLRLHIGCRDSLKECKESRRSIQTKASFLLPARCSCGHASFFVPRPRQHQIIADHSRS